MTVAESERIAVEFLQVWTVGNFDVLERLGADDLRVDYAHFPEPLEGREAFRRVLEETFRRLRDRLVGGAPDGRARGVGGRSGHLASEQGRIMSVLSGLAAPGQRG